MKKSIFVLLAVLFLFQTPGGAQGLLKKVTGAMRDELLGTGKNDAKEAEPSCACSDAELIVVLGGKSPLAYKEMNISAMDDGSLLFQNKMTGEYYIFRNGTTTGPIQAGDPRLAGFDENGDFFMRYKAYISKPGENYMITFGGKTYGPYAQVNSFAVTKSKDKFAAVVIESIPVTQAEGKKMDEEIKNAKTEQEKMELVMKYTQQMQQKMMQSGGPAAMTPKLITNVPDAMNDFSSFIGANINGNIKYDDLYLVSYDKIIDLRGKTVMTLKPEHIGFSDIFLNTANTKYAVSGYGSITFSDNTNLTDLFNPHLIKVDGQAYLAYMYYSPKKNALMQCKIPF